MITKKMIAGTVMSVGLAVGGLGLGAGTASALPAQPHQWCPGQSMYPPEGPGSGYVWDMTVCHTWQYVSYGQGNVPVQVPTGVDPVTFQPTGWTTQPESNVWEGPNPPPGSAFECGTGLFGGPISC
ncbi:hypothetical protein [Mycolicibacterium sp.]|uniref:hypothetical protein n=1 Tax=Mycolicibacterium sp. TaxID=2320850 RepID=UPI003D0E24CE